MLKTNGDVKGAGWSALVERLGFAGATLFVLEYEKGYGDYTEESKKIFNRKKLREIVKEIKKK